MDRTELLFLGTTAYAAENATRDRERAGLRGMVKSVSEGSTTTEYDPDGRLLSHRWSKHPNSESPDAGCLRTRTFDSSGRLLTDVVRIGSADPIEKLYVYDNKGRLLRIEGSGDHTWFQYDDQGRKTEIRNIAKASDGPETAATGIDVLFADLEGNLELTYGGIRNASKIKTIYNERDQPAETQTLDVDGHTLTRMVRSYDEQERIVAIRTFIDDPLSQFHGKEMADMIAQSAISLDEFRTQMKNAFGAMKGESGRTYLYDPQGRRTRIILHQGALGDSSRTYSYNDHGDVVEEHTEFLRNPRMPVGVPFHVDDSGNPVPSKPPSEWPPALRVPDQFAHYTYQYDSYGNWIEQTVTHSLGWVHTTHRAIGYH